MYSDTSYDAVHLLVKAISKSRREAISIRDALVATQWQGIGSEYKFSPQASFSTGRASLVCIRGGVPSIIKEGLSVP